MIDWVGALLCGALAGALWFVAMTPQKSADWPSFMLAGAVVGAAVVGAGLLVGVALGG